MTPREKARRLIASAVAGVVPCVCKHELDRDECDCDENVADAVMALFPEVEEHLSHDSGNGWVWPVHMPADKAKANRTQLVLFTERTEIDGG